MAKKNVLGKGLDALLSENEVKDEDLSGIGVEGDLGGAFSKVDLSKETIVQVPLDKIKANPYQPRKEFSEEELNELAESIKEHGVIEPIIVVKPTDVVASGNGEFIIVGGERRSRAARLAGLSTIPAVVKNYTGQQMLEIALIENIQRSDLNSLEEAMAYQQLMVMANLSQEEVAKRVGKNRSTIANSVRLLKLPQDMQRSLAEGKITAGHARAILSVINPSDQQILFARIIGSNLSVREAEQNATVLNGGGKAVSKDGKDSAKSSASGAKSSSKKDPDIASFEQKLIDHFGTKVVINGDRQKGTVQFSYFSADDLDRLYSLLLGEE